MGSGKDSAEKTINTISRQTMRKHTGVPETNQRQYERHLNIESTANYAITKWDAGYLEAFQNSAKRHAFVFKDVSTGRQIVAFRLPNSRHVNEPGVAVHHRRKRARRMWSQISPTSMVRPAVMFKRLCTRCGTRRGISLRGRCGAIYRSMT